MECHARSYREVAMEHAFMVMLLEMKQGKDSWVKETRSAIAEKDCSELEKARMESLKLEIQSINERLSEVAVLAQKSSAKDVYDDLSIDLTYELEPLQSELELINQKKTAFLTLKRSLKWLLDQLDGLKDFNPEGESINFREDIFRRIVQRGEVLDDGSILYELVFGVTRNVTGNEKAIWKIYQ